MNLNLTAVGPKSQAVIDRDATCLSTSYTREYPLVVDKAEGSEIWDLDGRRYIDFMAGIAVLNVGHRHPHVVEAVKQQVDKFWHICLADFYYPEAVELAEKLQAIAPFAEKNGRIYLGNSGTEAVEAGVKLAMYKTGRQKFIGFLGSFHGRTLGALSFTASKNVQRAKYRSGLEVVHVPYPNPYRPVLQHRPDVTDGEAVVQYIEKQLFRMLLNPHDVAGILVEPIQGEGGYVIPSPGFIKGLRDICDEYGIMLIVDEVQSGVGRTGKWWAIEHEQVEPDIVCFAKGVGSGMPIGGIIARDEVMTWQPGAHGSTFGGNPIAAVSSLATLQVIEKENLLDRAESVGSDILDALVEMQGRHPSLGDVRGRGLMIGLEFVTDRESKGRAMALRDSVVQKAFKKGLLLLPCGQNTIRFTPPLNIPESLVEEGLQIFEAALTEAEQAFF